MKYVLINLLFLCFAFQAMEKTEKIYQTVPIQMTDKELKKILSYHKKFHEAYVNRDQARYNRLSLKSKL